MYILLCKQWRINHIQTTHQHQVGQIQSCHMYIDVNDPYSEYGDEDHENAYTTVLNNIDTCTQTQGDPLKTGNFCRYDENESVLFRALREVEKLQDLIKDYKDIAVHDNRMMTRLIVHRTGAKVYRTYEGVTWLCKYSRSILFRCNYRYSTTSHTLFPCWYSATQIRGMKTVKSLSIKFTHHQELLSSHIHCLIYPRGIRMASLYKIIVTNIELARSLSIL